LTTPDGSVREAALRAYSSNLFPDRTDQVQRQFAIEPLIKALDDASAEVQETAFEILCFNLFVLTESNLQQLALPMLKRMTTIRNAGRLHEYPRFSDLARHIQGSTAQQRILLDVRDQLNKADNDDSRSAWLQSIGRLHLAFDQPNEAAAALQKAIRFTPNPGDLVLRDLENALESAGRSQEVALEPAPRPSYFELESRLRALAKANDVRELVRVANRGLDGYPQAYRKGTHSLGRGEPDQVVGVTIELLLALRSFDALAMFLDGAHKRYPESPDIAFGKAKLCMAQDRDQAALTLLERELELRYWNYPALDLLKKICTQSLQVKRYETLLQGLVGQHPGRTHLNFSRFNANDL
jgi:tetratricopeptide (TPR) repeat protein